MIKTFLNKRLKIPVGHKQVSWLYLENLKNIFYGLSIFQL